MKFDQDKDKKTNEFSTGPARPAGACPLAGQQGRGRLPVTASNGRNMGAWLFWSSDLDTGVFSFPQNRVEETRGETAPRVQRNPAG